MRLGRFVWLALAGLLLASAVFSQAPTDEQKKKVLDKVVSTLKDTAYLPGQTQEAAQKRLEEAKKKALEAKDEAGFVAALNGALRGQGFSHIGFMGRDSTKRRETGKTVGLGMEVRASGNSGLIGFVFPGSNAEKIGLHPGDSVLEVDSKPFEQRLVSGQVGSSLDIHYRSKDDGKERWRRVFREEFASRKPAEGRMLDKDTGYVHVWSFMRYSRDEVARAFKTVHDAKYLVVDLRSNGGGDVGALQHFLTFLLPAKSQIGFALGRDRNGKTTERPWTVRRENPLRFKGKVALLVNRGSASASEIVAAALQENKRAVLVGRKTMGAVLTSRFINVGEGFSMQVPIGDYKTWKGVRLEGHGVIPDVEVPMISATIAPYGQTDDGIETASKTLRSQAKKA